MSINCCNVLAFLMDPLLIILSLLEINVLLVVTLRGVMVVIDYQLFDLLYLLQVLRLCRVLLLYIH